MVKLRNTREPYDEMELMYENQVGHFLAHEYVIVQDDRPAPAGSQSATPKAKGKAWGKAEQPPSDLSTLADDISKPEGK